MENKKINLLKFRGNSSSLFTGRPQGMEARAELDLDSFDKSKNKITFIIPKGTSSINPSFYLGLLYDSIKHHGVEEFEQYYIFEFEDTDEDTIKVLKSNLEDGKRNAKNSILGNIGLKRFIKK